MVKLKREVCQLKTVSKITTQKSSKNRFNVYLDGNYAFSVDQEIYIQYHLHKGKQLTKEMIDEILHEDYLHRAYVSAIHYLSYRMRTESEIFTYLQKKEFPKDVIDEITKRLYDEKLLNDEQFARAFVKDRMERSTKGPLIIANELAEKGISKKFINAALTLYSKEKQREIATKWANKEVNKK